MSLIDDGSDEVKHEQKTASKPISTMSSPTMTPLSQLPAELREAISTSMQPATTANAATQMTTLETLTEALQSNIINIHTLIMNLPQLYKVLTGRQHMPAQAEHLSQQRKVIMAQLSS